METLEVKFRVITPMYMYGANQEEPEIRSQSIKGLIRFWYRSIVYARSQNWTIVKKEEARVFGSSDTGQAKFMLRVILGDSELSTWTIPHKDRFGLNYLGYSKKKSFAIKPGYTFRVILLFKISDDNGKGTFLKKQDVRDLELSLQALNFFGGMGSRSRRGFGSVQIIEWKSTYSTKEFLNVYNSTMDLKNAINNWFEEVGGKGGLPQNLPEYTAFNNHVKCCIYEDKDVTDCCDVLDKVGRIFLEYRTSGQSFGNKNFERFLPWKDPVTPRFWDSDHNAMYNIGYQKPKSHPLRVVFGLPHNYQFSKVGDGTKLKVNVTWESDPGARDRVKSDRRSSPFFIHIHEIGRLKQKKCVAVLTTIPSQFLPKQAMIKMQEVKVDQGSGKYRKNNWGVSYKIQPEIAFGILDELLKQFKNRVEVR